jgi:aminopeptidase N
MGFAKYKAYMATLRNSIRNASPVAPMESASASKMFASNDIYNKGAWILHTIRHYVGDESFFKLFRRFAYPDPAMELITNGKQCRLATITDFIDLAEIWSGVKLDWLADIYLRQATLPRIQYSLQNEQLRLKWIVPDNCLFSLPIDVRVGNITSRVEMRNGIGSISVPSGVVYQIDPDSWILMAPPQMVSHVESLLPMAYSLNIFPNPFNP